MGAPVHSIGIGTLPDNEGTLTALVQDWHEPKEEAVLATAIEAETLTHGNCSKLDFVRISDAKNVLCCKHCMLRITIPSNLKTLGDLKGFFATSP